MNRDDIIRMAREAFGAPYSSYLEKRSWDINDKQVERFAALVAAAEREACAQVCLNVEVSGHTFNAGAAPMEFAYQVCEATAFDCAAAIRARGEK